ncbi:hypothetical protein EON80_28060 [bacterium]|nr:MAG: hypothetical protein EON80_28060 [bacterium]
MKFARQAYHTISPYLPGLGLFALSLWLAPFSLGYALSAVVTGTLVFGLWGFTLSSTRWKHYGLGGLVLAIFGGQKFAAGLFFPEIQASDFPFWLVLQWAALLVMTIEFLSKLPRLAPLLRSRV